MQKKCQSSVDQSNSSIFDNEDMDPNSPMLRSIHLKLNESQVGVVIADGDELFAEGLSSLFERWPEFTVFGVASSYADAVNLCVKKHPAIVIMSAHIGNEPCTQAIKALADEAPSVHVMVVASSQETDQVLDAVRNGARGYCARDEASAGRMRALVWGVACGDVCFSGALGRNLQQGLLHSHDADEKRNDATFNLLSEREREILVRLATGMSNKEISQDLYLSEPTVKKAVSQIVKKLQVRNRTQAAVMAARFSPDESE